MKKIVVRQAGTKDIEILAQLDALCFDAPWSKEAFRQELEENIVAFYVVAEIDKQVIGYAGLWHIVDEGHITNVAVHPKWRGKHIAKKILSILLNFSEKKGMNDFTLEVRPSNKVAINLYEKFDFEEAGLRPGYYEDNGEDALIMWRRKK